MSDEARPVPQVDQRVNEFLLAVDRALAESGTSDSERRNVGDDLKAQIWEMLGQRAGDIGKASVADVEAVLSELDPPESYGSEEPVEAGVSSERSEAAEEQRERSHGHGHHHRDCGHGRGWMRGRWGHWRGRRRRQHIAEAIRRAVHRFGPFAHPLFARFTDRARQALAYAKLESRRLNHDYIGTEHLLVGLITEDSGLASKVLQKLGVDLEKARGAIDRRVKPGKEPAHWDKLPITPKAQRAIEAANAVAQRLGVDYVGTEHVLLGLLSTPDGVAVQVLMDLGVTLEAVRTGVLAAVGKPDKAAVPFTFWPAGTGNVLPVAGEQWTIVATGGDTGGSSAIFDAKIPSAAGGLPPHINSREDLAIYVIEGEVQFRIGDRTLSAAAGSFVNIPRGTIHSHKNAADAPARVMITATPAGMEKFIRDIAATGENAPPPEVAGRHGITFA